MIANGRTLQYARIDQLLGVMYGRDENRIRFRLGEIAGLGQNDYPRCPPFNRRVVQIEGRGRRIQADKRAILNDVSLCQQVVDGRPSKHCLLCIGKVVRSR